MPPANVLAQIVTAAGSGDPAQMRKVADSLDQQGWKAQAADLRAAADVLERAQAQNVLNQTQATGQVVDGSNWLQIKGNASTGYIYLQDPSGTVWPVAPGSIKTSPSGGTDFTLSDGRVVHNPPKSPGYYTEGGIPTTPTTTTPTTPGYVMPEIDGTGWVLDLTSSIGTGSATLTSPSGTVYTVTASQIYVDSSGNRKITIPNVGVVKNPTVKAGPVTVPGTQVQVPPVQLPTILPPIVPAAPGVEQPNASLAGTLAGQLTGATTANEPHATILAFQQQEGLQKQDGEYGTEVAWQMANVYNIVPPNPLHWGTKAGGYSSYVADKKAYAAHLQQKAKTDTARSDQWNKAAALALKGI